jgi:hypothetical protein
MSSQKQQTTKQEDDRTHRHTKNQVRKFLLIEQLNTTWTTYISLKMLQDTKLRTYSIELWHDITKLVGERDDDLRTSPAGRCTRTQESRGPAGWSPPHSPVLQNKNQTCIKV